MLIKSSTYVIYDICHIPTDIITVCALKMIDMRSSKCVNLYGTSLDYENNQNANSIGGYHNFYCNREISVQKLWRFITVCMWELFYTVFFDDKKGAQSGYG